MLLRTTTPKRLNAPSPITIALSEFLVLLKNHKLKSERTNNNIKTWLQVAYYSLLDVCVGVYTGLISCTPLIPSTHAHVIIGTHLEPHQSRGRWGIQRPRRALPLHKISGPSNHCNPLISGLQVNGFKSKKLAPWSHGPVPMAQCKPMGYSGIQGVGCLWPISIGERERGAFSCTCALKMLIYDVESCPLRNA